MITVVENFLDEQDAIAVEETLLAKDFPWYLNAQTVTWIPGTPVPDEIVDSPQFVHSFIIKGEVLSQGIQFIAPLLIPKFYSLNSNPNRTIERIKANLNTQYAQMPYVHYPPHKDVKADVGQCISAIYYVSDSDGDTLFFDGNGETSLDLIKRVTPKRNTLVYFDSTVMHAGCPPKESFKRCVINMVFRENVN